MSAEKYAYISVYKKHNLEELIPSLAPEYTIITMGGTKDEIEGFGIPEAKVILPEEFLGDAALKGYLASAQSEVERRDRLAVPIGHRMSRTVAELPAEPLIDWVYVYLKPGLDVGGAFMTASAIKGARSILTHPSEIANEVRWRKGVHTQDQQKARRREQGHDAAQALGRHFFYSQR